MRDGRLIPVRSPRSANRARQFAVEPQRDERADRARQQIGARRDQPEFARQPERDHRREAGAEQPSEVGGEGRAGVAVAWLEVRRQRPRRLAERQAEQREAERAEEHTTELKSLMRISYAVFSLKQ